MKSRVLSALALVDDIRYHPVPLWWDVKRMRLLHGVRNELRQLLFIEPTNP